MKGRVIFITGGTGTLGQALVKKILPLEPKAIRILTNDEAQEVAMMSQFTDSHLRFLIGDVRDKARMYRAMEGVDYVIHAAALKHVPICEYNPIEAVKTNIIGSMNIIEAAIDKGVEKVIATSTDKAVTPISIYGATKLAMEKLFTQANVYGKTRFSCTRCGNYEISSGSVVRLWREQLDKGLPITVTEQDMTRYWIPIDEAAQFNIDCIERMQGGEIFIPKLIQNDILGIMIREHVPPGTPVKFIGRRVGEKLNEILFAEGEEPEDCGNYWVIRGRA